MVVQLIRSQSRIGSLLPVHLEISPDTVCKVRNGQVSVAQQR